MSLTHAAIRARIHRAIRYWVPVLGLESWGLEIRFDECVDRANCTVQGSYEEAVLRFNPKRIKQELLPTYAAVEELALHELVHVLLPRESERQVSRVTRSLLRARDLAARGVRSP